MATAQRRAGKPQALPTITSVTMLPEPGKAGIRYRVNGDGILHVDVTKTGFAFDIHAPTKIAKPVLRDTLDLMAIMDREFRADMRRKAQALKKRMQRGANFTGL